MSVEFPLGIFVFALSSAILPSFSDLAAKNEHSKLKETFLFSFRLALFIIMPARVGLVILRTPIIHILFERGSFTSATTIQTSVALLYYALGLWAIAGVLVVMMPKLTVRLWFFIPMPLWVVIILFFVLWSFIPGLGIAWQAHIGGLVVGLIAGYFFRRKYRYIVYR